MNKIEKVKINDTEYNILPPTVTKTVHVSGFLDNGTSTKTADLILTRHGNIVIANFNVIGGISTKNTVMTLATLPTGYRPSNNIHVMHSLFVSSWFTADGIGRYSVYTNGTVKYCSSDIAYSERQCSVAWYTEDEFPTE